MTRSQLWCRLDELRMRTCQHWQFETMAAGCLCVTEQWIRHKLNLQHKCLGRFTSLLVKIVLNLCLLSRTNIVLNIAYCCLFICKYLVQNFMMQIWMQVLWRHFYQLLLFALFRCFFQELYWYIRQLLAHIACFLHVFPLTCFIKAIFMVFLMFYFYSISADVRSLSLPGSYEDGKINHLGISLKNFVRLRSLDLSYNSLVSVDVSLIFWF